MKKLEKSLSEYISRKKSQDECSGFVDGYEQAIKDSNAPELLEAIQYYFDVLEEVRGDDWNKKPDHVLSKMINAINKATL